MQITGHRVSPALLFLFFISGISLSFSQTANFTHFGVEQGLPQSTVSCLVQDLRGNLWIGTSAGVSKYNGLGFVNYSKKDGLAEDRITASCIDKKGNTLFGHWGGGLSRFDAAKNKMEVVPIKNLMVNKPVSAILQDRNGNLWVATEGLGLLEVLPSDTNSAKIIGQKEGLFSKNISSILEDSEGVIWFGTDIGITKFFPKENRFEKVFNNRLPSDEILCLFQEDKDHTWIGTRDSGLVEISSAGGKEKFNRFSVANGLPGNHITSICKDHDGGIWIGTSSGGTARILHERDGKTSIRTYTTSHGLSSNRILSVLADREGNVWLGSFLGLEQFSKHDFELFGIRSENEKGIVWAISPFGKKKFLLGTETGIFIFRPEESAEEKMVERVSDIHERVSALLVDPAGNTWAGIWGRGLCRIPANSKTLQWISASTEPNAKFIHALVRDQHGNIWLGLQKGGVIKVDGQTFKSESFGITEGFRSNTIQAEFCDSHGVLWFGTQGGLTKYDGKNFYTYTEKEQLNHTVVLCIGEDLHGTVFCGTYGGGIYKLNGNSFEHFENERIKTPYSLLFDRNNTLWVGGGTGACRFELDRNKKPDSLSVNGFSGIEVTPNAVCSDEEGTLWFGSLSGVVKYSPFSHRLNKEEPVTQITQILVHFKPVELGSNKVLSYDQNYLSFYFAGVSLTDPQKVLYSYHLEGIDHGWSPAIRENYINYPNLPPGKYIFQVKACNNDGLWNKQPASLSFRVAAPFWQTWWFRILYSVIGIAGVILFFRIRVRQIQKKETEKTELNRKIANIELKALRAQMNPHFIFNTMNSIQHFVIHNDPESAQKYLSKFAELIRTILTNSALSYIPLEEELKHLALYMELESLRFESKFEFEVITDPVLKSEHIEIPTMLIQPYIENAIVHGLMHKEGKGKITLRLEKNNQVLKCSIEDNGVGRKKAQEIKAGKRPKHKSMGMTITGERLEILNQMNENQLSVNILDLTDADGAPSGTRVELFIPIINN